ncbi:MAG: 5'/3'-nucleotidase SurE [Sphaerochaetaceae bacterium]|nr:5'/3'-nucleotidase SurE [Sphaerochaetaceae bacterium]MDC7246791.1 5'/3'-nucleotidase SurE [Sphaerochaetaceae bacterium]
MIILLTNDDGYQARGIKILEEVLHKAGHDVWVCAPSDQRSAQSHAMTLKGKVRIHRYGDRHYHCSGSPADCILYGLGGNSIPVHPDVVISGINHGYNASTDILYSGTVGAASEGALRGYPSIAVSARSAGEDDLGPFYTGAEFIRDNMEALLPICSTDVLVNINVPPRPNGKWRVGKIGQLQYLDVVEKNASQQNTNFDAAHTQIGLAYSDAPFDEVKVGGEVSLSLNTEVFPELREKMGEADFALLEEGFISVSPIKVNPVVDEESCAALEKILGEGR